MIANHELHKIIIANFLDSLFSIVIYNILVKIFICMKSQI